MVNEPWNGNKRYLIRPKLIHPVPKSGIFSKWFNSVIFLLFWITLFRIFNTHSINPTLGVAQIEITYIVQIELIRLLCYAYNQFFTSLRYESTKYTWVSSLKFYIIDAVECTWSAHRTQHNVAYCIQMRIQFPKKVNYTKLHK